METQSINGVAFKENSGSSITGASSLEETFDTFLLLLTTQLQNQDPLDPLDTNQFTEQLVNFSSVEQQIKSNTLLEEMVELQKGSGLSTAISMIGSEIEYQGDVVPLNDGTARMRYSLPANATVATVMITDVTGDVVRTLSVDGSAGEREVVWDGKDDGGALLPDGLYAVSLAATDSNEIPIDGTVNPIATVTGVDTVDGEIMLRVSDLIVPMSDLRSVEAASQPAPPVQ